MIDKTIKTAPYVLVPLFLTYLFAMFIYPLCSEDSWKDIQAVWDRWQALNVGVLAFAASVTAFYISHYKLEKQQERDFIATRAFFAKRP